MHSSCSTSTSVSWLQPGKLISDTRTLEVIWFLISLLWALLFLVLLEPLFIYIIPRTTQGSGWQPQPRRYNSIPLEPSLNWGKCLHSEIKSQRHNGRQNLMMIITTKIIFKIINLWYRGTNPQHNLIPGYKIPAIVFFLSREGTPNFSFVCDTTKKSHWTHKGVGSTSLWEPILYWWIWREF